MVQDGRFRDLERERSTAKANRLRMIEQFGPRVFRQE